MNMTNVDVLFASRLNSSIGPSQTIKRILKNEGLLREKKISIKVYSFNQIENKAPLTEALKQKLKDTSKNILSTLITIIVTEIRIFKLIFSYSKLKRKSDVVVFHHLTAFLFYCWINDKNKSKLILFQHNNGDLFAMGIKRFPIIKYSPHLWFIKVLFNHYSHRLSKIVFISDIASKNFSNKYPQLTPKIKTIINGIEDVNINLQKGSENKVQNKIKLVTVGTVSYRKGQNLLIESLAKLPKSVRDKFHLTIVGDGPDLKRFKALSKNYQLEDHIDFKGKTDNTIVPEILLNNNVYILVSHSEGLPLSNIEALRCGLPIITSNKDGCPETVKNDNGYCIEPEANSICYTLRKIMNEDLSIMGQKSRNLFETTFDFKIFLSEYIKLIHETTSNDS